MEDNMGLDTVSQMETSEVASRAPWAEPTFQGSEAPHSRAQLTDAGKPAPS